MWPPALMDWDDPEDPCGVPEDAMFYPVPSLSAEGGEIQFHGGIAFPGCPENALAYGDVLEVEGIAWPHGAARLRYCSE